MFKLLFLNLYLSVALEEEEEGGRPKKWKFPNPLRFPHP